MPLWALCPHDDSASVPLLAHVTHVSLEMDAVLVLMRADVGIFDGAKQFLSI